MLSFRIRGGEMSTHVTVSRHSAFGPKSCLLVPSPYSLEHSSSRLTKCLMRERLVDFFCHSDRKLLLLCIVSNQSLV